MSAPTIRAVQEFYCARGRCREVRLAEGPRHPVLLSVEQVGAEEAAHGVRPLIAALRITYRGHQEDLIALGCVRRESLSGWRSDLEAADAASDSVPVAIKPVAGHRRVIEVSYIARSRPGASLLPGVPLYCADWLASMAAPSPLRLVVDNTRRKPSHPSSTAPARLAGG